MKSAILIPAYNEATSIGHVVRAVSPFGVPIVVDDCSTDGTGEIAGEAGASVVRHQENRGYDGALQTGFEQAASMGVDLVVTFDADGQHGADTLERMLSPLRSGEADIVLGIRARSARFSEMLFSLYTNLRFGVRDILCGLKAYRMELFHEHGRFDGTRSIGTELALFALREGYLHATVPVAIYPRASGSARFGRLMQANLRILRAMLLAIASDLTCLVRGFKKRSVETLCRKPGP
jgi:glycosyltransferase involved in cell wall biosynthesis